MSLVTSQPESSIHAPSRLRPKLSGWSRSGWAVLLFFGLATVAFTWPLVIRLSDSLPDWGDPPDVAWRMGVIAKQLASDPLHLYKTAAFYPLDNGLALNELLTGQGLLAAPIYWLTNNPPLAYNLLNFISYVTSGWAMWLLVRHLTGSSGAGVVAGLIYTFSPWHYGQYGHLPLAAQQWMVLALYFLIRFLERTRPIPPADFQAEPEIETARPLSQWGGKTWLYLGLFVGCFVWQALVAGYFAYFETLLIGLFVVYYFGFESGLAKNLWRRRPNGPELATNWRQGAAVAGAAVVSGLLILPFVLPFMQAQRDYGFKRNLSEVSYWSAAPTSLLRTTDRSWLYNPIEHDIFGLQTSVERALYPGLIALGLAIFGLGRMAKTVGAARRPARRWLFLVVGLSGLILSFGPVLNLDAYGQNSTGITLPYKWLYDLIPGFDALRVAYRFGQLFMLGLAVLAGYGAARLVQGWRWPGRQWAGYAVGQVTLLLVLVGLVTADYFAPNVPVTPTPVGADAPLMYRWLASEAARPIVGPDDGLLELPISTSPSPVTTTPIYLMYSLAHGRPMLNGSANILPPGYSRLFYEMISFPSPATLDIAEGLGVKFLLVHTKGLAADANRAELDRQAGAGGRLELVKEFAALDGDSRYRDRVYRLKLGPARFDRLKQLIPEGNEVLLADQANGHRLYTAALPGLLGPNRRYFSTYATIYDPQVQAAQPNRVYDYGIFYRGSGAQPTEYGYNPSDLLPDDSNEIIQVYHKRPGLASFFSFQDANQPGHYLPFSRSNPTWLNVADGTVQQISAKDALQARQVPTSNVTLALILAAAEPQTVVLRFGAVEKELQMAAGFYRWQVSVPTPTALQLQLKTDGWAYLIQARLYNSDRPDESSEQLKGAGGTIVQSSSQPDNTEPGLINSRLTYYTESRLASPNSPVYLFQVNITSTLAATASAKVPIVSAAWPGLASKASATTAPVVTNSRRFGEWAVIMPIPNPGQAQVLDLRINLLTQKAEAVFNGQPTQLTINLPLSTADGFYQADLAVIAINRNQPIEGSPANANPDQRINAYRFRFSHSNGVNGVSDFSFDPPNALIILPSVNN